MDLDAEKRIHMVGIGGAGMSGIARILKALGKEITGSDLQRNDTIDRLEALGINVYTGHSADNLQRDTDLVVISSAIPPSNPEMKKAQRLGIPVVKRGDMLAWLMNSRTGIAIAGAHGKTTTTSMIAVMLEQCGESPSYIIGGELKDSNSNARLGEGKYFVAEADESDASFLKIQPYVAVVTNVEDDHLDYYKSVDRIQEAFRLFIGQVREGGFAVLNQEDPFLKELTGEFKHLIYYGTSEDADYYYTNYRSRGFGSSCKIWRKGKPLGTLELIVPGRHNVSNALAAVAVGTELGLPYPEIKRALRHFTGAKRRFHVLGKVDGIMIVDDYAHHPTEIEVTIDAARQFHRGRLIVIFQPHRYSRTKFLGTQFGKAFLGADHLIVTGIYGAGEEPIEGVTGEIICQSATEAGCNAIYIENSDDIVNYLLKEARPGDILLFMGAGDIWKTGEKVKKVLAERNPSS